ncbi:unnamed protein product [Brachionus calyciflorus]|uniref:Uncharacterized protein n=1 Tax=Brachionus calyciflorus TaxID=104777 RepID=A0A814EA10_9BILA|nr:unnamed protein product [Brachionus calyciflorus]
MLIAMMTRSYENIMHHCDTEWKFSRSKLYMKFIKDGPTVPVPFNLIPAPFFIYEKILKCLKDRKNQEIPTIKIETINNLDHIISLDKKNENSLSIQNIQSYLKNRMSFDNRSLTYRKVIERIVKRFFMQSSRDKQVVKKNFIEFKQDVQIVKQDVLNDFKSTKKDLKKYSIIVNDGVNILMTYVNNKCKNKETIKDNLNELYYKKLNIDDIQIKFDHS